MALIDKISNHTVAAHTLSAGLYLYSLGEFTRQNIIDGLELEASDEAQLDNVLAYIDGLTASDKLAFHGRIEACNVLLEQGKITTNKYKSMIGIS